MNFQNCNRVTWFPSHSFEQYYQAVRRCWRFGQKRPVTVDIVMTEGDALVMENLARKQRNADRMFAALVGFMQEANRIDTRQRFDKEEDVPEWL
jgi:SNF2 family DNA or RNA helicase